MSQRTFTLTGTCTDFGGNPIANAPCSFQPIVPGNLEAVDGGGKFVQTKPVAFTTDGTGSFSVIVDYPGDFQSAYVNTQVRATINGVVTDSPVGFAYAASIALTSWINAPITTGLVTMRGVYTTDGNAGIAGVTGSVVLSSPATVVATGQILSSTVPTQALSAGDGTMLFSLNPNSLLNPNNLGYSLTIDGEFTTWSFIVPSVVDVYRGAWNSGTAYVAASGSSNGDVVANAGVLYRCVLANTNQAPPNATYWHVVSGLPTDMIAAHLTAVTSPGSVAIGSGGVLHSADVPPLAGDPESSPSTLSDDLENLVYRDTQRLRYLGAWGSGTAYVANDVALSGGIDYICILGHTNHVPPNATYWVALGGTGGGGGSSTFTWVTKTSNYTLTGSDSGILLDATSGDRTATLPTAIGVMQLFAIGRVLDGGAHNASILTTSAQTVNGLTTWPLAPGQVMVVGSDGANWEIYASYYPNPLTSEGDIPYLHNGALARLTLGTNLSISGGVLNAAGSDGNQAANTVKAGPTVGPNAAPTYRTLVSADLPIASTSALGGVKADGSTITVTAGGVITAAASGSSLASLSDTTITSPQEGDYLIYKSGKWKNVDPTLTGAGAVYWVPLTDSGGGLITAADGSCIMVPAAV